MPTWFALLLLAAPPADVLTQADRTHDVETGRYEEVQRLCTLYARIWSKHVRCQTFGMTPQGRPMMALVATRTGAFEPAQARKRGLPVVLTQAGIHAGEIDGKDAGFRLMRTLLEQDKGPHVLDNVVWVFVPVFNVDGHERFGPNHRPNQVGPRAMGWRTTAQNLNLNRDYTKAETPEMAAMLGLLQRWDPTLYVDLHVTDGADFQPHVGVVVEPRFQGAPELMEHGNALREAVLQHASTSGWKALGFYPSFRRDEDPASGFAMGSPPPRFSTTYWALHNRLAALVETHSWKPYATRVQVMMDVLTAFLQEAAAQGGAWLRAAQLADRNAQALASLGPFTLAMDDGPQEGQLDFPGCAYTRRPSAISGGLITAYDCTQPEVWRVPFHPRPVPVAQTGVPGGGYLVPPQHAAWVAAKLRLHGVAFTELKKPWMGAAQHFVVAEKKYREGPYEGRQTVSVKGEWQEASVPVQAGWLFVPTAQPLSRLVVHLLEPAAPDSLVAWGFFNAHWEQKEYMEPYVLEPAAQKMLAEDDKLRDAFTARLESDKAFAASPQARLDFFYRHHPAFDAQWDIYPVLRTHAVVR